MQRPISDRAAIGFSTAFYRHLAKGDSIDVALTEGRQAIHSAKPESFEWATPVLFLRMPEGNVFVARPAEPKPVEVKPQIAPPPAPAPLPAPVQAAPKRGMGMKVAAGAAGAVVVGILVVTVPKLVHSPVPEQETPMTSTPPLTTENSSAPQPVKTPSQTRPHNNGSTFDNKGSNPREHSGAPPKEPTPSPSPTPPSPETPKTKEIVNQAPADLSKLLVQVASVERQESLRVTVIFRNTGDHALAVTLDESGSMLQDDKRSYQLLESNLPSSGELDLPPNGVSQNTFSFPLPQLGSSDFHLTLIAAGQRKVLRFSSKG
jgi:hypothetical protein